MIRVEKLVKRHGALEILKALSLTVEKGEPLFPRKKA